MVGSASFVAARPVLLRVGWQGHVSMGHTPIRTDEMHNGTTSQDRSTSHDRSTHRNEQLRILILEDVKADAELMVRALRRSGLEFAAHYVAGKESFHHQLDEFVPDLVLSDYEMPRYNGMDAIADVHERCPATPVIIVTGALNITTEASRYSYNDRASDVAAQE